MGMKTESETYQSPALGCKLGTANQILLRELDKTLREAELPLTTVEYPVLRALYYKDGTQQCEIAEMVGRDKSAICRCVSGLVKKGLVRTIPVSYKCQRVYLTGEALSIQSRVMSVAESRHQALVELLGVSELEVFDKILDLIINNSNRKEKKNDDTDCLE